MSIVSKNLVELESVGCWFDSKSEMVYPMLVNGDFAEDQGTNIYDDMSDEWFESLSPKDFLIVNKND